MLQRTSSQLVGKRYSQIVHFRNDALSTPELNFLLPDTVALRTVSSAEAPLIFAWKKCRTVFLHDVTDRKTLEVDLLESRNSRGNQVKDRTLSLEESRSRLTMAVEHFSEGYALFGTDHRLILANRRFRSILPKITHLIKDDIAVMEIWSVALTEGAILTSPENAEELLEWFESSTDESISTIELSLSHDRWARCAIKNLPTGLQIITLTELLNYDWRLRQQK